MRRKGGNEGGMKRGVDVGKEKMRGEGGRETEKGARK